MFQRNRYWDNLCATTYCTTGNPWACGIYESKWQAKIRNKNGKSGICHRSNSDINRPRNPTKESKIRTSQRNNTTTGGIKRATTTWTSITSSVRIRIRYVLNRNRLSRCRCGVSVPGLQQYAYCGYNTKSPTFPFKCIQDDLLVLTRARALVYLWINLTPSCTTHRQLQPMKEKR